MSEMPVHSAAYKRRRFLNWFPLGLTYAFYYMGRYNLNVAGPTMMEKFDLTKGEFGMIATCGFWIYALSVLFNGPLADRIGGKKAIVIGAFGAAVLNFIIGMMFFSGWTTKVLVGMCLLYAVNQYFQSFGALSVVKVNSPWFHVKERGVFGGIFGILISLGYSFAYAVGGWILAHFDWYMVFLIPSAILVIMGVIDLLWVKDTPAQAGFENFNTGDASSEDKDKDKPLPMKELLSKMFHNKVIVTLMVSEFCTGFIRQGLLLWFPSYLKDMYEIAQGKWEWLIPIISFPVRIFMPETGDWSAMTVSPDFAVGIIAFILANIITIGGILGGIVCGWLSDKVFDSRRPPVAGIFYLMQIAGVLMLVLTKNPLFAYFSVGFTCMFIFGVHGMLTGTASMDFGGTRGASTVAGLLDGVQYFASGFAGFGLGLVLDKVGWNAWLILPVFSIIGFCLMLTIWNERPVKKGKEENKEPAKA